MSLLSDQDVDAMRSTLVESLPDSCVIQTLGGTIDANGEGTRTWTNAGTVDCRIASMGGDERARADRVSEDADWIITLPADTAIAPASRIISSGVTYDVKALRGPRSFEISHRVEATELT